MSYKPIVVSFSDKKLRILVEEYITQQKAEFTSKGVCSYILFWAMEDGKVDKEPDSLFEGNELQFADKERVRRVLETIANDGRIEAVNGEMYHKL